MPLRNRVLPTGEIVAVPERGTMYGNRGVLHDGGGRLVRDWAVRRWLVCELEFKGRRRPLLRPGRYTELFFVDEATALAAGHRPCAECRRPAYDAYRQAIGEPSIRADDLDRRLHAERLGPRREADVGGLPGGAFVLVDGQPWLVLGDALREWTPGGYGRGIPLPAGAVTVLTPPTSLAALRGGYVPLPHPSAA